MSSPQSPRVGENITDDVLGIYDLRDVSDASRGRYSKLYYALSQVVTQFTVEFLYTKGVKPHVVFKLNFRNPSEYESQSARLSMEMVDDEDGDQGTGAGRIKLCNYSGRTTSATGGFEFTINRQFTLLEIVQVIKGRYRPSRGRLPDGFSLDLSRFEFITVPVQDNGHLVEHFDGCRDWIAQVFVRLHTLNWVGWTIKSIILADDQQLSLRQAHELYMARPGNSVINWRGAGFHDVIGKAFDIPIEADNNQIVVFYNDLPLECGIFDPGFRRNFTDSTSRYLLPYRGIGTQGSGGRSAGRGASGSGSGAGSSRGGSSRGGGGSSGYGGGSGYGGSSGSGASSSRGGSSAYDYGSGGGSAYSGGGGSSAYSGGGGSSAYSGGGGGSAYDNGEGYNYGGGSGSGTSSRRGGGSGSRGSGGGYYSGSGGSYYY